MADSSTEATPSTISPSTEQSSPADHHHHIARAQLGAGNLLDLAAVANAIGNGLRARLAQRVGLRLAAAFRHGLREVGKQHGEPQPQRDLQVEPKFFLSPISSTVVITLPISTTNITGLPIM
jgi:hypothetical protein